MSEEVIIDHVDLGMVNSSPGMKRKRIIDSSSPDSRRSKRNAPAAAMTADDTDAFLENTVSIAQAAQAQAQTAQAQVQDHADVVDFSALAQATADHGDVTDSAAVASSTAAAALNLSFPTLHVPPSTEETFAAQAAAEQQQHQSHHHQRHQQHHAQIHDNSFTDGDSLSAAASAPQMPQINGIVQDSQRYSTPHKPAVGSEEWHKMRKDNHKEGERTRCAAKSPSSYLTVCL